MSARFPAPPALRQVSSTHSLSVWSTSTPVSSVAMKDAEFRGRSTRGRERDPSGWRRGTRHPPTIGAQRSQVEALSPTWRMLVPFGERQEMLFQPSDLAWGQEGREARAAVIDDLATKGRGGLMGIEFRKLVRRDLAGHDRGGGSISDLPNDAKVEGGNVLLVGRRCGMRRHGPSPATSRYVGNSPIVSGASRRPYICVQKSELCSSLGERCSAVITGAVEDIISS